MRCPEFRETMSRFIDGRVDSQTRKEVGLHLAECEECCRLIEGEKFWDEALLSFLDREAPADLRAQILADTVGDRTQENRLSRDTQLRIVRWAATRNSSPRQWLGIAAMVACILLFVHFTPMLFSFGNDDSFTDQGQVAVVSGGQVLSPDSPLVSGSLSLSGRLF
ncbi:MAG: zf-HC2 domain-containing protein [Gemmatimonadales bacterium]|nr:zf-HC2 domain-containing protein [Gemmatimonadales bacterium]